MLLEIYDALRPILSDPNVVIAVLYRIDGTPIFAEIKERNPSILTVLYYLESQIKDALYQIFNRDLSDFGFKFRDYIVRMYPISRTLVLTVILKEDVSLYKFETDVSTVCMQIREIVGYDQEDLHTLH